MHRSFASSPRVFSSNERDDPSARRIPDGQDFLDPAAAAHLTPAELARRTAALAPLAAAKAADAERLRRPVAEVWAAIRASGFFYQFVPRAFGGLASDPDDYVDVVLPIARACPSTAWSACFCAAHNINLAHFPAQAQQELWGGAFPYIVAPMVGSAGLGRAVPVDGGYRVTASSWSWASGIMDADWVFGMALVADRGDPPPMLMVLFPAAAAEVVDTWNVDGLAGSGSNDVRVENLFVPEYRTLADMRLLSGQTEEGRCHPEPIFQAPFVTFATFTASVPVLGAAQGALEHFRDRLAQRVEKGSNAKSAESPAKHVRLAEADLMISTAETLIRDSGRKMLAAARMDGPEQIQSRIAIRARLAHAVKQCRDAVLLLAEGAGSSVHRLSEPFQRHVRDIGVMASHVGFDVDQAYELHGRSLLGLEPKTMMF